MKCDSEICIVSLFQEFCSIDSERHFFNALQTMLPELYFRVGTRRNYNARKRHLASCIEQFRRPIAERLASVESDNIKLIDSMPIEDCRCTVNGVIIRYDLSPAHHHDINYLNDIRDELSNCILIGDKGYRSDPWRHTLFEYAGIELATPCRKNELIQYDMPEDYQRLRKRVEVIFSQLVDQFVIRKSYAKSQKGLFPKLFPR